MERKKFIAPMVLQAVSVQLERDLLGASIKDTMIVSSMGQEIEVPGEDQYDILGSETYELSLTYDQAVFTWERYRGRVEG